MAACKQHYIGRHLQSARQWLARAEQAFGRERDVRGQLDLFLAQAELQHVSEMNRAGKMKFPLLWQGAALMAALVLLVAVWGGYNLWTAPRQQTVSHPNTVQTFKAAQSSAAVVDTPYIPVISPAVNFDKASEVDESVANTKAAAVADNPAPRVQNEVPVVEPEARNSEVRLTPEEMQKLVRTAGKSLRGQ